MMRAIGYARRMVITNFAMESAFISILGIVGEGNTFRMYIGLGTLLIVILLLILIF